MTAPGLRTWLPQDFKKISFVTDKLIELYSQWSYQEIEIPTLIGMDVLSQANVQFRSKIFRVVDKDGEILALRPELTPSIAKAISTRSEEMDLPVRLFYSSSVFRHSGKATDESREMHQVGIELVGSKAENNFSNSEVLHLFLESANQFGIQGSLVVVTHSSIWQKIYEDYPGYAPLAFALLEQGNLVEFKKLIPENHPIRVLIESTDVEEVEKELKVDLTPLKELSALKNGEAIFDPSLCPDIDFYTGVYFNLLIKGQGDIVAVGGRYDSVYKTFGTDLGAIGFAYYIPNLITALQDQELLPEIKDDHTTIKPKASWEATLAEAQKKIKAGKKVKIDLETK